MEPVKRKRGRPTKSESGLTVRKKVNERERIITNIDQINGVTPEQLLEHATFWVNNYQTFTKKHLNLIDVEKQEAINDTVINVYRKMREGTVPKFNYHDFKGYFYRAFLNAINLQYAKRNFASRRPINNSCEYEPLLSDNLEYSYTIEGVETSNKEEYRLKLREAISTLDEKDRNLIRRILGGETIIDVAKEMKIPIGRYHFLKQKLRNILLYPKPKTPEYDQFGINKTFLYQNYIPIKPRDFLYTTYQKLRKRSYRQQVNYLLKHGFPEDDINKILKQPDLNEDQPKPSG